MTSPVAFTAITFSAFAIFAWIAWIFWSQLLRPRQSKPCPSCPALKSELNRLRSQFNNQQQAIKALSNLDAGQLRIQLERAQTLALNLPCLDASPGELDTYCLVETPGDLCECCAVKAALSEWGRQ